MNKFYTLLITATLFIHSAFAQVSNLILFTEQGEQFTVILNGIKQNDKPETNVKVTGLKAPNYKLKVIFENKNIPDMDKNVFLEDGSEVTYSVKKNAQGAYTIRLQSAVPISEQVVATPHQNVVTYHSTPAVVQQTTTTTTYSDPNNVNINMGIGGVGVNMNVNGMDTYGTSQTTTTTTTTSSNSYSQPVQEQHQNQTTYVMPGYSGAVGCPWPLSRQDFEGVKNSISSKSFDETKLTVAKQVIASNCLLSSQVKEIMLLFSFEDTRLDLAKYAYGYTFDIGNYYQVNDAFSFSSSVDELNSYINGYKR